MISHPLRTCIEDKIWALNTVTEKLENCGRRLQCRLRERLIQQIENGPCGLVHVWIISYALGHPIQVETENGIFHFGVDDEEPLKIKYEKGKSDVGHWTLFNGSDPQLRSGRNTCLLDAIAHQWTGESLLTEIHDGLLKIHLTDGSAKVILSFEEDPNDLVAGAKYYGETPEDAGVIIDRSQGRRGDNAPNPGHPRGHVSNPTAAGPYDSVEMYSRTDRSSPFKSGFFTVDDQNAVVNDILKSGTGSQMMDDLNRGQSKVSGTPDVSDRGLRMGKWQNGQLFEEALADEVVLVLQHQSGKRTEVDADPHILTCYPKSTRGRKYEVEQRITSARVAPISENVPEEIVPTGTDRWNFLGLMKWILRLFQMYHELQF